MKFLCASVAILVLQGCTAALECSQHVAPAAVTSAHKVGSDWVDSAWRSIPRAIALPYPDLVGLGKQTRDGRVYRKLVLQAEHDLRMARRYDGQQLADVCPANPSASYIYALHIFALSQNREEFASNLQLTLDLMTKMEAELGNPPGPGRAEKELERRFQLDQYWSGRAVLQLTNLVGGDENLFTLAYAFAQARGCEVARENVAWLDAVFDGEGWPSKARYGKDADRNAWVIAQHADFAPRFQRKALSLLRKSVARGDGDPRFIGYLTDRYRVNTGRRQIYGTQYRAVCGGNIPFPIADPTSLDARRNRLGMEPWAEYNRRIGRPCKNKAAH